MPKPESQTQNETNKNLQIRPWESASCCFEIRRGNHGMSHEVSSRRKDDDKEQYNFFTLCLPNYTTRHQPTI